jgi:hypothetical protein
MGNLIFLLDNPSQISYDKDDTKMAMKKRSTVGYPAERIVHRLQDDLGEAIGR